MDKFIPVNEPLIGKREKELINECLDTGWISSEGPFVEKFEHSLSKKVKRKYGIACSSGTAALDLDLPKIELALRLVSIEPILSRQSSDSLANSILAHRLDRTLDRSRHHNSGGRHSCSWLLITLTTMSFARFQFFTPADPYWKKVTTLGCIY